MEESPVRQNHLILSMICVLAVFLANSALAAPLASEPFAYPNGTLIDVSGNRWESHSGFESGPLTVCNGAMRLVQANVQDVNINLSATAGAGSKYYAAFDLVNSGAQSTAVYFAHFKVSDTNFFNTRIFVQSS